MATFAAPGIDAASLAVSFFVTSTILPMVSTTFPRTDVYTCEETTLVNTLVFGRLATVLCLIPEATNWFTKLFGRLIATLTLPAPNPVLFLSQSFVALHNVIVPPVNIYITPTRPIWQPSGTMSDAFQASWKYAHPLYSSPSPEPTPYNEVSLWIGSGLSRGEEMMIAFAYPFAALVVLLIMLVLVSALVDRFQVDTYPHALPEQVAEWVETTSRNVWTSVRVSASALPSCNLTVLGCEGNFCLLGLRLSWSSRLDTTTALVHHDEQLPLISLRVFANGPRLVEFDVCDFSIGLEMVVKSSGPGQDTVLSSTGFAEEPLSPARRASTPAPSTAGATMGSTEQVTAMPLGSPGQPDPCPQRAEHSAPPSPSPVSQPYVDLSLGSPSPTQMAVATENARPCTPEMMPVLTPDAYTAHPVEDSIEQVAASDALDDPIPSQPTVGQSAPPPSIPPPAQASTAPERAPPKPTRRAFDELHTPECVIYSIQGQKDPRLWIPSQVFRVNRVVRRNPGPREMFDPATFGGPPPFA